MMILLVYFFFYFNGKPDSEGFYEEKRFVLDLSSGSLGVGTLRPMTACLLAEFRGGEAAVGRRWAVCVFVHTLTL